MKIVEFNTVVSKPLGLIAFDIKNAQNGMAPAFVYGEWVLMNVPKVAQEALPESYNLDSGLLYASFLTIGHKHTVYENVCFLNERTRMECIDRNTFVDKCHAYGIDTSALLETIKEREGVEKNSYLSELFDTLNVTDSFDKAILAAIVVSTISENRLAMDVDREELIQSVIGNDVSRCEFDVCYLATTWINDLTDSFCSHIHFKQRVQFFPDIIWPYLRRKSPMKGVKLMP